MSIYLETYRLLFYVLYVCFHDKIPFSIFQKSDIRSWLPFLFKLDLIAPIYVLSYWDQGSIYGSIFNGINQGNYKLKTTTTMICNNPIFM